MNSQDFRSLQEAYNQVHQVDEDAGIVSGLVGLALGAKGALHAARKTKRLRDYPKNFVKGIVDPRTYVPKKKKEEQKEQADLYDTIRSYLLEGGYAETPEAAEVIMVNMSEEWRQSIVEAKVDEKLPEHERSGARLKRYDNPSGSLALGGGQQRARRAEHEERRGKKK